MTQGGGDNVFAIKVEDTGSITLMQCYIDDGFDTTIKKKKGGERFATLMEQSLNVVTFKEVKIVRCTCLSFHLHWLPNSHQRIQLLMVFHFLGQHSTIPP